VQDFASRGCGLPLHETSELGPIYISRNSLVSLNLFPKAQSRSVAIISSESLFIKWRIIYRHIKKAHLARGAT